MKNVMEVIKKNLVSVICAVVALLAIGAIFWPINSKYADLQADVDKRLDVLKNLQTLANKKRQTPQIPGQPAQGILSQYPTQPVIDAWKAVTDQITKESSAMFNAVVDMNTHKPLMDNVLPAISRTYDASQFRLLYRTQMDLTNEETRSKAITQVVNAGFFPSTNAIKVAQDKKAADMLSTAVIDPVSKLPADPNFQQNLTAEQLKVPDELKAQLADQCMMYVDTTALDPSTEMMNGGAQGAPDASQIFVAQLGYWIQSDALKSLADANKGATNVKDAPVKRLFKIKIAPTSIAPFTATTPGPDAPPATGEPSGDWKKNYAASPTGRVSNGVYDVFPFTMQMIVDADQVGHVMRELSRNKLITVLRCDVQSIDSAEAEMNGYYYGNKPVVQLRLGCEDLLLRKWTEPLMPDAIRKAVGLPVPAPAAKAG